MTEPSRVEPVTALFKSRLSVVNLGLASFADNLAAVGAEVAQVDWRPPAGGDAVALDALDRIANGGTDVDAANKKAVDILLAAKPTLIDIGIAGEVIPGMTPTTVLHSGPPVTWERMCGPMKGGVIGGLIYEGLAKDRAEAEALGRLGPHLFRALPRPRRRRPDGGHRHRQDAGVDLRERRLRQPRLCHGQRGARQGSALRRLLRRGVRRACAGSRRNSRPS